MFDVVIETKDGDLNEKGVSWQTRNALVDWFYSFKFDDSLLLLDPSFETKEDQNDLDDWACIKKEEFDDVEFDGNKGDVQFSGNHAFFWFIIPQMIQRDLRIFLCSHWQEDAVYFRTFQYSSLC